VGLSRLADTRYSEYEHLAAQARASSLDRHTFQEQAKALGTAGASLNLVGAARSHAKDLRIPPIPPIMPAKVPAFGLP
jgi:hypothetical protein